MIGQIGNFFWKQNLTRRAFREFNFSRHLHGAVVGCHEHPDGSIRVSNAASILQIDGGPEKIQQLVAQSGGSLKVAESRLFYGLSKKYPVISVVGLGCETASRPLEGRDENLENVRNAVAAGVAALQTSHVSSIDVDACGDAQAAAEGAHLRVYKFNEFHSTRKSPPTLSLLSHSDLPSDTRTRSDWERGVVYSGAQNYCRHLMEYPSNYLTPEKFSELVNVKFGTLDGVTVRVRDIAWIKEQRMTAFLAVAQGSKIPPIFLEIEYSPVHAPEQAPKIALVGKGVTFDSGGINLKPTAGMPLMRADMGGAACVTGVAWGAAKLALPVRLHVVMPLCENMPSGAALKPGDVVSSRNGKTIQVDNTDAEGRLILADALSYIEDGRKWDALIDVATLTGAMAVALGEGCAGVFSSSDVAWKLLEKAGYTSGDRVWRMPLYEHYRNQVINSHLADISNVGKVDRSAGACTAAAFLKEFVAASDWMHIDMAGVMENKENVPHLSTGLSGRPTRTLLKYLELL